MSEICATSSSAATRGSTFFHPPLKFRIDFPTGWEVQNSPAEVVAKAPNAEIYMMLELVEQPRFEEFLTLPAYDRIIADERKAA